MKLLRCRLKAALIIVSFGMTVISLARAEDRSVEIDILATRMQQQVEQEQLGPAVETLRQMQRLDERPPPNLYWMEAKLLKRLGRMAEAEQAVQNYLREAGQNGKHYQDAVKWVGELREAREAQQRADEQKRQEVERQDAAQRAEAERLEAARRADAERDEAARRAEAERKAAEAEATRQTALAALPQARRDYPDRCRQLTNFLKAASYEERIKDGTARTEYELTILADHRWQLGRYSVSNTTETGSGRVLSYSTYKSNDWKVFDPIRDVTEVRIHPKDPVVEFSLSHCWTKSNGAEWEEVKTRESIGRIILGNREQVQELYKLIVATRNLRWVIVAASSESMIPQQFSSSFKVSANRFSFSDERVFSAAIVKAYRQYLGSDWKIGRVEVNATQAPNVKSLLFHHPDAPHAGVFTQYDCTRGGVFSLNHDEKPLSIGADWGVQVTLKNDVVLPLRILGTVSTFEGGVHRLDLSRLVD